MPMFKIEYGIGPGFGDYEEIIECKSLKEAELVAYNEAVGVYQSYEGLHGIRDASQIEEEDEVSAEEAEDIYNDEVEQLIEYSVKEVFTDDGDHDH